MEKFIKLDAGRLPEMAELYKTAFRGEPWNDDWSDEDQLYAYITDLTGQSYSLTFGYFDGDQLIDGKLAAMSVGMIRHWWEGTNYNIEEFCVSPELQGQGIGSRFMRMIENDIRDMGLCGIFLQTDSDKPSFRFYQKNGFKELDRHVSFYKRVKK